MSQQLQDWLSTFVDYLPNLLVGVSVLVVAWLVARTLRRAASTATRHRGAAPGVEKVIGRVVYVAIMSLGVIVALSILLPNVNFGAVLGALGVGGIIAGFALKELLENWVAGIMLILTRPFVIGDQIITNTDQGTVTDIQFRATVLKTPDHRAVIIPNAELYTSRVTVETRYPQVRQALDLTFPNSYSLETLRAEIVDVLGGVDGIDKTPAPDALVVGLGDYSNTIRARFWVGPPSTRAEVHDATDRALSALAARFSELGIQNIRPESTVFTGGEAHAPAPLPQS